MEPLTSQQLDYFRDRMLPPTLEVCPGIHAVAIPFRDPFVRFTYCYLIEDGPDRLVVVDPGADHPDARKALLKGLSTIGRELSAISVIVVTHHHIDHVGGAGWLSSLTSAPTYSHPLEMSHSEATTAELLTRWGVPADERAKLSRRRHRPPASGSLLSLRALGDGPLAANRRVIPLWTPGHTPGHMCFAIPDARALLTGDHVLPVTRSAIATAWPLDHRLPRSPVTAYLDSLESLGKYTSYAVLPGHEYAFTDLANRLDELREHQEARSRAIRSIVRDRSDLSVWQVASRVDWTAGWDNLDVNHRRLALAQTEAHLLRIRG